MDINTFHGALIMLELPKKRFNAQSLADQEKCCHKLDFAAKCLQRERATKFRRVSTHSSHN